MKPWSNEPTPIVDRSEVREYDMVSSGIARDLERRLRHAEGLLREHQRMWGNPMVYNDHLEWMKKKDAHLRAAEQEGGR